MSKKDEAEKVPGKGTFSFKDYIAGKSTFPVVEHTIYLNQEAGFRLLQLSDEYTTLAERAKTLQAIQSQAVQSSAMSLVDSDFEKQMDELQRIIERTDLIDAEMQELQKKYLESAMTIHFKAGAPQKLIKTLTQAEKEFKKLNGPAPVSTDEDDNGSLEYSTLKGAFVVATQLAAYTVKVLDADGDEMPVPTRDEFLELMDMLISAEANALINKVREATDASVSWSTHIDAGFPGRGSDLGGLSVGRPRTEDRPLLDTSPADAAAGEEEQLV